MKRFLILIVVVSSVFALKAQEDSGNDIFEKGFTLKTAYISPLSNWGDFRQLPLQYGLQQPRWGLGLQLGTMFFLNGIDIGEDMRIGIDVTWMSFSGQSAIFNYRDTVNYGNSIDPKQGTFNIYHFYLNPEFGPMFSFSPGDNMALDVSFKFSPGIGLARGTYRPDIHLREGITGLGYGIRYTPAFYFRYDVLLVGVEVNLGSYKYSYEGSDFHGTLRQDTPYSTARIVLGFKF